MTTIPSDPFMLMSYVNQQLRDNYDSLDEFCKSMDIDKNELLQKLNAAELGDKIENRLWITILLLF